MMMETNQMTKKILNFQKDVISQWYDVVTSMHEQAALSLKTVLDQSDWMPDEGRRMVQNWVDACQKGCDDYKELVADSLSGLEKVLVIQTEKAVAPKKKKPAAKRTTVKRTTKRANAATAAKKTGAAPSIDTSEEIVPPIASQQASVMKEESTSVADTDSAAK